MSRPQLPFPSLIPLSVGLIAIAFSAIFIKWCMAPASVIGMYRLYLTVVLFLPMALLHRRSPSQRLSHLDWLWVSLSGVFLGLHFLFWIDSLKHTSVASSMIITTLQPVFVMIGAYLLFRERTSARSIGCMAIAILGAGVIALADIHASTSSLFGDMESLLGTIAVSLYMLAGQGVRNRMPSLRYNTVVFTIAGTLLAGYNLIAGIALTGYGWGDWRWFILLALVPTVFGHALFNWLLKYVSATAISVTVLGEPVGAIVLASLLLHEQTRDWQWIGGILCLLGVGMFLLQQRQTRNQSAATVA